MGIEPTSSAWKAEVLPLNYTRLYIHIAHFQPIPARKLQSILYSLIWRVIQHSLICQLIITINTQVRFLTKQNHSGGGGRIRTYEG